MATSPATRADIEKLAEEAKQKILAHSDAIEKSQGEVALRIFRRNGGGYDLKLSLVL